MTENTTPTISPDLTADVMWASYSSLAQHRVCPQRWLYARIRKLEALPYGDDVPVERDLGSWGHMLRAADALARGRRHDSLKWVPEELTCVDGGPRLKAQYATPRDVLDLAIEWWARQPPRVVEAWEERIGEGLPERLLHLYQRWLVMWQDEIKDERPLAVEMKWTRRLPMPLGYDAVELIGYVDEIYQDTKRNILVVRDHKFAKDLTRGVSAADDMMDSQLQFYAWGAAPLVKTWGVGAIQATAYDRACMVAPKPPKLTTSGKLATRLGEPTISASDLHTYLIWAKGPDGNGLPWQGAMLPKLKSEPEDAPRRFKDGGIYTAEESVIERLSTPEAKSRWFQRTTVPLNRNLIKAHLLAGVESAMDVQRTRKRAAETGAAGRNLGSACRFCDFAKLCRAEMWGGVDGTYDLGDMCLREKAKRS